MSVKLSVNVRGEGDRVDYLRRDGGLPAVIYGLGKDPASLKMNAIEFEKLFRDASYNTVIDLDIDGSVEQVLVTEVQYHPVTDLMLHVDFIRVDMKKVVETEVKLVMTGVAPAIKNDSALITVARDFVHVRCLPTDLVHEIEVSVEVLVNAGDSIHIKDIEIPSTLEVLDDLDVVVAQAVLTRANAESDEEEGAAMASPDDVEVTTEKKED